VFGAFVEGWRRVLRAPALAIWVLAAMLAASVPLAIRPGDLIGGDVVSTARTAMALTASAWAAEEPRVPPSPGTSLYHTFLGFGRTLATPYILFWVFLSGGLVDRLARGRPVGTAHFFAVCGVFLFRFARLGLMVAGAYYVLFRLLRPQISGRPEAFVFLAGLALVTLIADFAKVRAVVEDRRSMLGACLAALRFIRSRPIRAGGVFALHILTGAAILQLWSRAIPGPIQSQWAALGVTVLFLLIMIVARLAFMASEVAIFQRELAHASYAAAPELVWPDSPAVEAIQNFTARAKQEPRLDGTEAYEEREGSTW
jgi:hypothetical protein